MAMADRLDRAEAGHAGQPLADRPEVGQVGHSRDHDHSTVPWLNLLGFLLLTFNSGMAICRSNGDFVAMAFVVFSYLALLMLFACLRWYEPGERSSTRSMLKACIWVLTTLLTAMFSYKVVVVMPLPVAIMVLAMAGAAAGGLYALFVHKERERQRSRD